MRAASYSPVGTDHEVVRLAAQVSRAYIPVYIYTYILVSTVHAYVYADIHIMYASIHTYIHTGTHICIYMIYTYLYIHIYRII